MLDYKQNNADKINVAFSTKPIVLLGIKSNKTNTKVQNRNHIVTLNRRAIKHVISKI